LGRALTTYPSALAILSHTGIHPHFKFFLYIALCREIEAAENQCRELEKVVAVVEKNRQRFRHIDNVRDEERLKCLFQGFTDLNFVKPQITARNWAAQGFCHQNEAITRQNLE